MISNGVMVWRAVSILLYLTSGRNEARHFTTVFDEQNLILEILNEYFPKYLDAEFIMHV